MQINSVRIPGWQLLAAASCAAGFLLLNACASPNIYATARTVPKGQVSHSVGAEGIGASLTARPAEAGAATDEEASTGGFWPAFPAYQVRYGLTDELEIGGRIASLGTLGLDFKYNFLRDKTIDLAVDPGAQAFRISTNDQAFGLAYFYLPLIVDVNLSKAVSLVFTPGVMMVKAFGTIDNNNEFSATGVMLRAGGGLNIRFSDRFSLQPELTIMKPFDQGDSITALLYSAGIGINFGALPGFGDEPAKDKAD